MVCCGFQFKVLNCLKVQTSIEKFDSIIMFFDAAVSVQSLFPGSSVTSVRENMARPKGIYINENLTPYRKEIMSLAVEKGTTERSTKCGHLIVKSSSKPLRRESFVNCFLLKMSKNFKNQLLTFKGRTAGPSRNTRTAHQTD